MSLSEAFSESPTKTSSITSKIPPPSASKFPAQALKNATAVKAIASQIPKYDALKIKVSKPPNSTVLKNLEGMYSGVVPPIQWPQEVKKVANDDFDAFGRYLNELGKESDSIHWSERKKFYDEAHLENLLRYLTLLHYQNFLTFSSNTLLKASFQNFDIESLFASFVERENEQLKEAVKKINVLVVHIRDSIQSDKDLLKVLEDSEKEAAAAELALKAAEVARLQKEAEAKKGIRTSARIAGQGKS